MDTKENATNKETTNKKAIISKKTLWKALRRKFSEQKICDIAFSDATFEKDDYYDYQLIYTQLDNCLKGKLRYDELMSWLILVTYCLCDSVVPNEKIADEYGKFRNMVYTYLDAHIDPFCFNPISKKQKKHICRELLAGLKSTNHKIEDLRRGEKTDFTTNNVITYVTYVSFVSFLNEKKEHPCHICVVDKEQKRINYLHIPDMNYREDINYTFLDEDEFENLPSMHWEGYKLDPAMPADYAIKKK